MSFFYQVWKIWYCEEDEENADMMVEIESPCFELRAFKHSLPETLKDFTRVRVHTLTDAFVTNAQRIPPLPPFFIKTRKLEHDLIRNLPCGSYLSRLRRGEGNEINDLAVGLGLNGDAADKLKAAFIQFYPICHNASCMEMNVINPIVLPTIYPGGPVFNELSEKFDELVDYKKVVGAAIGILEIHAKETVVSLVDGKHNIDKAAILQAHHVLCRTDHVLSYLYRIMDIMNHGITDIKVHFAQLVATVFTPLQEQDPRRALEAMKPRMAEEHRMQKLHECSFVWKLSSTKYSSMLDMYNSNRPNLVGKEATVAMREAIQEQNQDIAQYLREYERSGGGQD